MTETLKPCPFCGGEPKMELDEDTWTIECPHHGWAATDEKDVQVAADISAYSCVNGRYDLELRKQVYTPEEIERARKKAIELWNRRAERTCRVNTKVRRFSQTQTLVTMSCSACGYVFGSEEVRPILPGMDETMVLDEVIVPKYCPNCGAKVVEE